MLVNSSRLYNRIVLRRHSLWILISPASMGELDSDIPLQAKSTMFYKYNRNQTTRRSLMPPLLSDLPHRTNPEAQAHAGHQSHLQSMTSPARTPSPWHHHARGRYWKEREINQDGSEGCMRLNVHPGSFQDSFPCGEFRKL